MHVISQKAFKQARMQFPVHADAIITTYKALQRDDFPTPDAMRNQFSTLDNFKYKNKWWVIDIAGNHLRLIAFIEFRAHRVYVKHIVTHAEYDKLCKRYAKGEL
jgi:mRNA interferase HigB